MSTQVETITPSVHTTGFTLVEEDDVAFSLSLCKEIHRIYGSYQSGELESSDSVHLGLSLTMQVLTSLAGTVTKGMPAMRIDVAAAQAREMMAVMFGEPIMPNAAKSTRPLDKRCSRALGPQTAVRTPNGRTANSPVPSAQLGSVPEIERVASNERAQSQPIGDRSLTENRQPSPEVTQNRVRLWFGRQSLVLRMMIAILGCTVAAVLVDVPIVMLLLYSNMWMQLVVAYIAVGLWSRGAYRRRRRLPTTSFPALAAA